MDPQRMQALSSAPFPELPPGRAPRGALAAAATAPGEIGPAPVAPVSAPGATTRYQSDSWFARGMRWLKGLTQGWTPWVWVLTALAAAQTGYVAHLGGWPGIIAIVVAVIVWGKAPKPLRDLEAEETTFARRAAIVTAVWVFLASQNGAFSAGMLLTGLALAGIGGRRYRKLRSSWLDRTALPPEVVAEPEPEPEEEEEEEEFLEGLVLSPEQAIVETYHGQMHALACRNPNLKWLNDIEIAEVQIYGEEFRSLTLQLLGGIHTTDKFDKTTVALLNSGLRRVDGRPLRHDAITVQRVEEDSTQIVMHIREADPLRSIVPFELIEPHMPTTITKPLVFGRLADRSLNYVDVLYYHALIGGGTRGGKTNTLHTLMAALARCEDVLILFIDMKGGRAGGPWLPRVDWLATDGDEAVRMCKWLQGVVTYRSKHSDRKKDKHIPTAGEPAIFLVVDEAAEILGERCAWRSLCGPLLESITSLGAGLAIHVILATQWPDLASVYNNILRGNLLLNICHSMRDQTGGSFVLGNDAYSKLDPTLLTSKGSYYLRLEKAWPTAGRTPLMTPGDSNDLIHQLARAAAATAPRLDAATARAGDLACDGAYRTRAERLDQELAEDWLQGGFSYGGQTFGNPPQGVPEVAEQAAVSGGSSAPAEGVPEGVPGEVPQGVPAGVPGGVPVPPGAGFLSRLGEGFPGGSPAAADGGASGVLLPAGLSARWAELTADTPSEVDTSDLTPEQMATVRELMASIGMDEIMNQAFDRMALALTEAPEGGMRFKDVVAISGAKETFVKQRLRILVDNGSVYRPGGTQGRYAAKETLRRADLLDAFWDAEREIKVDRRRIDEREGVAS